MYCNKEVTVTKPCRHLNNTGESAREANVLCVHVIHTAVQQVTRNQLTALHSPQQ